MDEDSDYLAARKKKRSVRAEEGDLAQQVRAWHESGELRHLHGQPLDLSDDSPDWFMRKTLRQEGFSHPAVERAREIDEAEMEAEEILERLRRRREWLARSETGGTPRQAHDFNVLRSYDLARYRDRLVELNRAIRDYNLTVPDSLHRRQYVVDDVLARVGEEIKPLDVTAPQTEPARQEPRSIWSRMRSRGRRSHDRG